MHTKSNSRAGNFVRRTVGTVLNLPSNLSEANHGCLSKLESKNGEECTENCVVKKRAAFNQRQKKSTLVLADMK